MAKEKSIVCVKNEINLKTKTSKGYEFLNLTKDHIKKIQFDTCQVKKLFRSIPTEKIEIETSRSSQPIVYYKFKENDFFEEYKKDLLKFAEDNMIKVYDNVMK